VRRRILVLLGLCVLMAAGAQPAGAKTVGSLDMYTARVSAAKATQLIRKGYDISDVTARPRGTRIDLVLTRAQRASLARQGVKLSLKRTKSGRTVRQVAVAQAANGFNVWRSWDEPGGIRDELYEVARNNPGLVKLKVIGHSIQGREIIALKVMKNARHKRDGSHPAALYTSTQHAREWISTEVNRRTLHWFIDQYKSKNKQIRELLKHTELWFVLVANPDGYQYTFDHERLWRKNLHDNDGDGQITGADGVDPNRNFNEHWNYDNEGSSSIFSSETFRGTGPVSEPETQAMQGLIRSVDPETHSNLHSYGPLILFPQGWIVGAPDADNPIYTALGGTDANPAIEGFDPGVSAEELYVTNGETTDFADVNTGALSFTPELEEGCEGCGFVFPDNEALIQAEFEKVLPFHLSLARSAQNPAKPKTATGMTTKPFYLDQDDVDPENGALAAFDFKFKESYGDPQDVRVLARKSLGKVTAKYQVNGGSTHSASTSEWRNGESYGVGNPNYYRVMRGFVHGTDPGDTVKVWFEAGGKKSESFTYEAVSETGRRALILSAEDYTGASPVQDPSGPHYLSFYEDALAANNIAFDVYDVDAHGRTAPDNLGVLSHYDAVLWYTGDDTIPRETYQGPGNASRLAVQELYEVREFLNEGGRALYTGKHAGTAHTAGNPQFYDPFENAACVGDVAPRCRPVYGSGDGVNDVLEYWLGAALVNIGAGTDDDGNPFSVLGVDDPFTALDWSLNGGDSGDNQNNANSFITTSGLMPADEYPQFESWVSARYDRPGGPFDPHTGEWYVHSQIADVSYKRLTNTVTPQAGDTLSFWTSYNTEADWDFMFVEVKTPDGHWTTLPDVNGHTSNSTGLSCPEGWRDLHPHLDHYQTLNADGTCSPTGTDGEWNAASGSPASGGWEQWQIDLTPYAGQQIELSIAYASDWATQGLGVFLDDVTLAGQFTSFETDLGGWTVTGPPEGSAPNANNFERITGAGFPEGAAVTTDDTVLMGHGVEGITEQQDRTDVIGRAMEYLLR
jgi:zinc carboxypeptidase